MNLKFWKSLLLLSGVLLSVSAFSQGRRNLVMFHDPVKERDTIVTHVRFLGEDSRKQQYEIGVRLKDGSERTFKASEIYGYRDGRKRYFSRKLKVGDEVRHVALPRMYGSDSVAVYLFIQDNGKRKYYVEVPKDSLLVPLVDERNPAQVNPRLLAFLKGFPVAQDEWVAEFFDGLKPTVVSFEKRHRVAHTGNPNHITRFRWGVRAGAGFSKAVVEPYDFGNKLSGFGGLFADIPVYESLSVRPEVVFCPYGFSSHQPTDVGEVYAVYNRKDVTGSLLACYTLRSFRGKWLPYAVLGPEFNLVMDKTLERSGRWMDGDGYMVLERKDIPQTKGMSVGVTGGVGVEYILSNRHSLFFDVRYRHELIEEGVRGICFSVSFNL